MPQALPSNGVSEILAPENLRSQSFGVRSGSVWGPRRVRSESTRGPLGVRARSVRGPFGVRARFVRGPRGVRSGSVRDPFAVRAGSVRDLFGIRSGSVRGAYGVRSESVRDPKPPQPKNNRSPGGVEGGAVTPPSQRPIRLLFSGAKISWSQNFRNAIQWLVKVSKKLEMLKFSIFSENG